MYAELISLSGTLPSLSSHGVYKLLPGWARQPRLRNSEFEKFSEAGYRFLIDRRTSLDFPDVFRPFLLFVSWNLDKACSLLRRPGHFSPLQKPTFFSPANP